MGIRVAVIGGSIGGLSSALALHCINCEVNVFERSSGEMKSQGAGLVVQMELVNFLKEHGVTSEDAISVPAYKRQYISKGGSIISEEQTLQLMTSWDNVYRQLKNALPDNLCHNRKKLTRLKQDKDYVIAEFEDGQIEKCDLLVGVDGSGSTVRKQLLPEVISKYAGYVAWRGVVDESSTC